MKKILLSAIVVITFTAYALHQKFENPEDAIPVSPEKASESSRQTNTSFITSIPTPTPVPVRSGFKDGIFTGTVVDAYYGNVQVQIKIQGGKITDVQFLDYPQDRRTSIAINTQAMPYLKSEAIQAQNAQVDIVSGATATSRAFRESLQSALDKAK